MLSEYSTIEHQFGTIDADCPLHHARHPGAEVPLDGEAVLTGTLELIGAGGAAGVRAGMTAAIAEAIAATVGNGARAGDIMVTVKDTEGVGAGEREGEGKGEEAAGDRVDVAFSIDVPHGAAPAAGMAAAIRDSTFGAQLGVALSAAPAFLGTTVSVGAVSVVVAVRASENTASACGYDNPLGWAAQWPMCSGHRQSPVNLISSEAQVQTEGSAATLLAYDVADIVGTMLSVGASPRNCSVVVAGQPSFGELDLLGTTYYARRLRFHAPSEHLIDGPWADAWVGACQGLPRLYLTP